jgi:hypothetical protein
MQTGPVLSRGRGRPKKTPVQSNPPSDFRPIKRRKIAHEESIKRTEDDVERIEVIDQNLNIHYKLYVHFNFLLIWFKKIRKSEETTRIESFDKCREKVESMVGDFLFIYFSILRCHSF